MEADLRIKDLLLPSWDAPAIIQALNDSAKIVLFSYCPRVNGLVSWSSNFEEVLGANDLDLSRNINLFLRHIHPDDRYQILQSIESCLDNHNNLNIKYRWIRPNDKQEIALIAKGSMRVLNDQAILDGMIMDVGDLFKSKLPWQAIINSLDSKLLALDLNLNLIFSNCNFNFGDPEFLDLQVGDSFLDCFSDFNLKQLYKQNLLRVIHSEVDTYSHQVQSNKKFYTISISSYPKDSKPLGLAISIIENFKSVDSQKFPVFDSKEEQRYNPQLIYRLSDYLQSALGQATSIADKTDQNEARSIRMLTKLLEQSCNLVQDLQNNFTSSNGNLSDLTLVLAEVMSMLDENFQKISVNLQHNHLVCCDHEKLKHVLNSIINKLIPTENSSCLQISTQDLSNSLGGENKVLVELKTTHTINCNLSKEILLIKDCDGTIKLIDSRVVIYLRSEFK